VSDGIIYAICRSCQTPVMRPLDEFSTCDECGTEQRPYPVPPDTGKLSLPTPDMFACEPGELPIGALVMIFLKAAGGYRLGVVRSVGGTDGVLRMMIAGATLSSHQYELEEITGAWVMGGDPV